LSLSFPGAALERVLCRPRPSACPSPVPAEQPCPLPVAAAEGVLARFAADQVPAPESVEPCSAPSVLRRSRPGPAVPVIAFRSIVTHDRRPLSGAGLDRLPNSGPDSLMVGVLVMLRRPEPWTFSAKMSAALSNATPASVARERWGRPQPIDGVFGEVRQPGTVDVDQKGRPRPNMPARRKAILFPVRGKARILLIQGIGSVVRFLTPVPSRFIHEPGRGRSWCPCCPNAICSPFGE